MFFEFFDWKIKLGIVLTVALALGSVVSFIYAWTAPVPTDAFSAVNKYLHYRWFAFFIVSTFSTGAITMKYHHKQLNRF
ncbi:hypothetical protein BC355_18285 [Vibrio cholerae]|uniref:Uncharacterized protein n=1 Tax=Vibrio cholerae TaxID=666 RepID=A0A395TCB3_VIBCL|nr:hypothetical protein BC354_18715 [Vibrio cholerae]RGP81992.1 hypothetical protein BC355_18285 [Vibrio cholerae]RGP82325.1 hypothetical protein BC353_18235 [Vibrio cholerae]RGP92774.1 hypothetical protein BC352_18115 [Vibrio cholerae]TXY52077.1 hypothetical protein FXE74_19030 [Vibrio cholerae]